MGQNDSGLSHLLGRRAVPAMAMLVVVILLLMVGLLVQIAWQQDRQAAKRADSFARAAIDRRVAAIAKDIKDYAAWGEAYQHLHVRTDVPWAFAQQNLGATLFHDLGYEGVFVVGPAGKVTYAVVNGALEDDAPPGVRGSALDAMVAAARAAGSGDGKPAAGFIDAPAGPLLAAAAPITPGGDPTIVQTPGDPSVLVFVDALSPARLIEIGAGGFVQGLRVARDGDEAPAGASFRVPTADQAGRLTFVWDPERPGRTLLAAILPWFCLAGVTFTLLTVLVTRRTLRAALTIEANARALHEAHRQAEHAALHDGVTQLPNRLLLHRYLGRTLADTGRRGQLALLYLDLDRFKPINDLLGHRAGDDVLRTVAERLRGATREGGIAARVGGDEFVLTFTGLRALAEVDIHCRRLIEAVQAPIMVEGRSVRVGLSIGVAWEGDGPLSAEDMLRQADLAMYQAKAEGGNAFRCFSAELDRRVSARMELEHDLRRAVAAGEFAVHFQPRYDTASMCLLGVEALLRWRHPVRGLLGPPDFMAVAEDIGLMGTLGGWVLRRACVILAPHAGLMVSVNVSAAQFRAPDLVAQVEAALAESGLPAVRLELELPEQVLLDDIEAAIATLHRLKSLGVELAMDDFGTGCSSLGYLRRLPFDRLKIDGRFVADLHASGNGRALVQAILGFGRALNMGVTAKGVETPEQLRLLRADRCDEVQGHHLSEPLSEEDVVALFRAGTGAARAAHHRAVTPPRVVP